MSISVTNNPDGTFTVSCGAETVIIGAGAVQKAGAPTIKPGRRGGPPVIGGIVVAGVVAGARLPEGTISVSDPKALMAKLRLEVKRANTAPTVGKARGKELHFSLDGVHTLDVGKVSAITSGENSLPILTRIYIGKDNG